MPKLPSPLRKRLSKRGGGIGISIGERDGVEMWGTKEGDDVDISLDENTKELVILPVKRAKKVYHITEDDFMVGEEVRWSWLNRMIVGGYFSSERIVIHVTKLSIEKLIDNLRLFINTAGLHMEPPIQEEREKVVIEVSAGEARRGIIDERLRYGFNRISLMLESMLKLFNQYDSSQYKAIKDYEKDVDKDFRPTLYYIYAGARCKSYALRMTAIPTIIPDYKHIAFTNEVMGDLIEKMAIHLEEIYKMSKREDYCVPREVLSSFRNLELKIKELYEKAMKSFLKDILKEELKKNEEEPDEEVINRLAANLANEVLDIIEEKSHPSIKELSSEITCMMNKANLQPHMMVNLEIILQSMNWIVMQIKGIAFSSLNQIVERKIDEEG